jgi:hypothetical protein
VEHGGTVARPVKDASVKIAMLGLANDCGSAKWLIEKRDIFIESGFSHGTPQ